MRIISIIICHRSLSLVAVLFMAGCASLPGMNVKDIDSRKVAYAAGGEGAPVIVLESGMGSNMSTWSSVFDSLIQITSVFAYDRPGYGHSRQHRNPASATELVRQLHQNLTTTGQTPPYLVVGHSAGGLYVNIFARMYPHETAGVVLLDSSHPRQTEYFRNQRPMLYSAFLATTAIGKTAHEADILINIHGEFEGLAPFPDVPLTVLTAERSSVFETSAMRKQWLEFQKDIAGMSSRSVHKIVEDSGHFIHKDKPQAVIDEITRFVNLAK